MASNYNNDIQASKEFIGMKQDFISKNPSTATASNLQGRAAGGFIPGITNGGGFGMGQMVNDSFDLDIMMPPDINSIDSDISNSFSINIGLDKLGAMTPTPNQNNLGWGFENN